MEEDRPKLIYEPLVYVDRDLPSACRQALAAARRRHANRARSRIPEPAPTAEQVDAALVALRARWCRALHPPPPNPATGRPTPEPGPDDWPPLPEEPADALVELRRRQRRPL